MDTASIDDAVREFIESKGGYPSCLHYEGFPKSCCISINDVVCHGIPSKKTILKEGGAVIACSHLGKPVATFDSYVKKQGEKGKNAEDLTREEFMKYAWEGKEEHGGIILQQLRKLGASCDWDRLLLRGGAVPGGCTYLMQMLRQRCQKH